MNRSVCLIISLSLMTPLNSFATMARQVQSTQQNSTFIAQLKLIPFPEDILGKPSRFDYLRKLLEISSGAKKVFSSDNVESHNAYIAARKTYILAAKEADKVKVNSLLDQTVKWMYQAIRKASSKRFLDKKKERDYKSKLTSVNALVKALERIAIEKNNIDETTKLKIKIDEIISGAGKLLEKHYVDKAREMLDEAYLLTKTGIENMRSGDVLIKELRFESIEEEYAYELDRSDTHQMLIKLLVEKKLKDKPDSYKKKFIDRIEKAKNIRELAEKLANGNDHKNAIAELEKSTKELVRAIRMGGGIYSRLIYLVKRGYDIESQAVNVGMFCRKYLHVVGTNLNRLSMVFFRGVRL